MTIFCRTVNSTSLSGNGSRPSGNTDKDLAVNADSLIELMRNQVRFPIANKSGKQGN